MKKRIFAPRVFLPRRNGARVYFSCSRCFLSRKAAKGSCFFSFGSERKEAQKKALVGYTSFGVPWRCCLASIDRSSCRRVLLNVKP